MRILLLLLSFNAYANPEIGKSVSFPMDTTNPSTVINITKAQCKGGVYPDGNGMAWGEMRCDGIPVNRLPWYNVTGIETNLYVKVTAVDLAAPCELYTYSNSGVVTQYNSYAWYAEYIATAKTSGVGYNVDLKLYCGIGSLK